MAMKKKQNTPQQKKAFFKIPSFTSIHPRMRGFIYSILALFFGMAIFPGLAGTIGDFVHQKIVFGLVGYGFIIIPPLFLFLAYRSFHNEAVKIKDRVSIIAIIISLSSLIHLFFKDISFYTGGQIGRIGDVVNKGFNIYITSLLFIGIIGLSIFVLSNPHTEALQRFKNRFKRSKKILPVPATTAPAALIEIPQKAEPVILESHQEYQPEKEKKGESKKKKQDNEEDNLNMTNPKGVFASSYTLPPLSLLGKSTGKPSTGDIKANAHVIQRTLMNFGIAVEMDEISIGPTVTRYAMKPAQGVRLSKIASLQNELALALAAKSIRIEAPIPGRSLVGIEVPNSQKSMIGLGTILGESEFQYSPKPLLVSLGKSVAGISRFADLAKMPHALIAGATGSGKSVAIHNIIMSLLYKNGPDMLRFIMIDPKRVEMTLYKKIPHLLTPVITDPKKAVLALKWAIKEMERRYDLLQKKAVRDIDSYHKTIVGPAYKGLTIEDMDNDDGSLPEKMPYILVIIDELSDIMSSYPRELEAAIVRLAQMSRAVGIHLLLATQRPSVNVITGLIKANVPSRMALKVASQIDSRTILDTSGAEKLLGQGDMLYRGEGSNEPVRVQCPYVSEEEVKAVVSFIEKHTRFDLDDTLIIPDENLGTDGTGGVELADGEHDDPMLDEARAIVIASQKASTSYLQRRLSIGYSRAARIIDLLEERGVIGSANGSKPREVYEQADDHVEEPEHQSH